MEGNIININEETVQIQTSVGTFIGKWCSNNLPEPRLYILELDSDELITSEKIDFSESQNPYISYKNDKVILCGYVEEIENNVLVLRINKSILLLNIFPSEDFSKFIQQFVILILNSINIYDTELI